MIMKHEDQDLASGRKGLFIQEEFDQLFQARKSSTHANRSFELSQQQLKGNKTAQFNVPLKEKSSAHVNRSFEISQQQLKGNKTVQFNVASKEKSSAHANRSFEISQQQLKGNKTVQFNATSKEKSSAHANRSFEISQQQLKGNKTAQFNATSKEKSSAHVNRSFEISQQQLKGSKTAQFNVTSKEKSSAHAKKSFVISQQQLKGNKAAQFNVASKEQVDKKTIQLAEAALGKVFGNQIQGIDEYKSRAADKAVPCNSVRPWKYNSIGHSCDSRSKTNVLSGYTSKLYDNVSKTRNEVQKCKKSATLPTKSEAQKCQKLETFPTKSEAQKCQKLKTLPTKSEAPRSRSYPPQNGWEANFDISVIQKAQAALSDSFVSKIVGDMDGKKLSRDYSASASSRHVPTTSTLSTVSKVKHQNSYCDQDMEVSQDSCDILYSEVSIKTSQLCRNKFPVNNVSDKKTTVSVIQKAQSALSDSLVSKSEAPRFRSYPPQNGWEASFDISVIQKAQAALSDSFVNKIVGDMDVKKLTRHCSASMSSPHMPTTGTGTLSTLSKVRHQNSNCDQDTEVNRDSGDKLCSDVSNKTSHLSRNKFPVNDISVLDKKTTDSICDGVKSDRNIREECTDDIEKTKELCEDQQNCDIVKKNSTVLRFLLDSKSENLTTAISSKTLKETSSVLPTPEERCDADGVEECDADSDCSGVVIRSPPQRSKPQADIKANTGRSKKRNRSTTADSKKTQPSKKARKCEDTEKRRDSTSKKTENKPVCKPTLKHTSKPTASKKQTKASSASKCKTINDSQKSVMAGNMKDSLDHRVEHRERPKQGSAKNRQNLNENIRKTQTIPKDKSVKKAILTASKNKRMSSNHDKVKATVKLRSSTQAKHKDESTTPHTSNRAENKLRRCDVRKKHTVNKSRPPKTKDTEMQRARENLPKYKAISKTIVRTDTVLSELEDLASAPLSVLFQKSISEASSSSLELETIFSMDQTKRKCYLDREPIKSHRGGVWNSIIHEG